MRVTGVLVRTHTHSDAALRARVTIAADGRRSALSFGLGLASHPVRPRRWAVGAYFEGVADHSSMGEMHIRTGEYVGVAPLADGVTNICVVGTPASLMHLNESTNGLADRDRSKCRSARSVGRCPALTTHRSSSVRSRSTREQLAYLVCCSPAMPQAFIDPMTGDGLRFAVKGAELAAEAALEMLATGNPQMHLALLARRRRRAFASKWRFNRTLRRVVDSPAALRSPLRLAATIAPSAFRRLVAIQRMMLDWRSYFSCWTGAASNGSDRCDLDCRASESPHAR